MTSLAISQTRQLTNPLNTFIYNKCYNFNAVGGINWWNCGACTKGQLFTSYKGYTGLAVNDSMHLDDEWQDSFTYYVHTKYQQYYKGIPMEGVYYVEHSLDNKVLISNGFLCEGMNKASTPTVTEPSAFALAVIYCAFDTLAWNDDSLEYYLNIDSSCLGCSYFPDGELIWTFVGTEVSSTNYKLAWKFRIRGQDRIVQDKYIYVDALTGAILKAINAAQFVETFNHYWYGIKGFDNTQKLGNYYLHAKDDGRNIKTKHQTYNWLWDTKSLSRNNSGTWNNNHWAATASHWAVQESWEYWKLKWARSGMDNNNKELRVYAHDPRAEDGAAYQQGQNWEDVLRTGK